MKNVSVNYSSPSSLWRDRMERMLRLEWLGQTAASIFWIVSVFTYGVTASGDWLQLCAASSWLVANIATILAVESQKQ